MPVRERRVGKIPTPMTFRSDAAEMEGHASPLLVGGRIFTAGVNGRLQRLEQQDRRVAVDTNAMGGTRRDASDVWLRLESDRFS